MRKFIPIAVILIILAVLVSVPVSYYNKFISLGEAITNSWAQVENQLKRRNDLIPNLVESTKGYMGHEKEIFTHIADARTKLAGARDLKGKVDAARELDGAFARLLAVVENYPNLKANETFQRLMDELSGTENRIAVERMRYNERVREYNITIKRFPGNVFASWFKRKEAPYFKAKKKEKKVPEVKF